MVGSKQREARTALGSGAVGTAVAIEVVPWRTAEVGGGSEGPYAIPTATLQRSASSAAACANVRASCRIDPTISPVLPWFDDLLDRALLVPIARKCCPVAPLLARDSKSIVFFFKGLRKEVRPSGRRYSCGVFDVA
ncbi:hypothetical protein RB195_019333 [Necator americanus]|uniref:Ig-like domain-containing protein n=1 Tax=Necator americanus TaxID=51031 RepID=A0ABR1CGI0_NECAM